MKVFSKERFIKVEGKREYIVHKGWVDECDGKTVKDERCGPYGIIDDWCVDVPDNKKGEKKMYTMKDFREKKIAVRVGTKHIKEFLQMCEADCIRWASGDKATEFVPGKLSDNTVITMNDRINKGSLTYSTAGLAREHGGMTIVDFEDFEKQPAPASYKITIESDGTTTTARMEINGKEVKAAQAKLHPADKFSWRVGAETAFGRLFDNGDKKEPAEGVREVKRIAKIGEWVKIVCKFGFCAEKYKNGDICKVTGSFKNPFTGDDGWVYLEGETCATGPEEYVVLDGYKPEKAGKEEKEEKTEKPEKKEQPFRVGDRVVCMEATHGKKNIVGKHGRVIGTAICGFVAVEFDEYIGGHNCGECLGKDGYCWNCMEKTLRHE